MLSLFIVAAVVVAIPMVAGPALVVALARETQARRTHLPEPEIDSEVPSSLRFA